MQEVTAGLDGFGAETPFKERAAVLVFFVIGFGVTVEDVLRQISGGEIAILPDEEVIMIGLQAIGDHAELIFAAGCFQFAEDKEVVAFFSKDGRPADAAIVDVIVHPFLPGQ